MPTDSENEDEEGTMMSDLSSLIGFTVNSINHGENYAIPGSEIKEEEGIMMFESICSFLNGSTQKSILKWK